MKVNFDNQRQQMFTAFRYKNDYAVNKLQRIIEESSGKDNPISHFKESSSAKNLQTWFERFIVEPLEKIDGDMLFDGDKIYCRWFKNGNPEIAMIPVPLEKSPEVSRNDHYIIRYFAENPLYIKTPSTKTTKKPLKKLFLNWVYNKKYNEPIYRDNTLEYNIRYQKSQKSKNTVGSEIYLTPKSLHPFIVGRELLQEAAAKSENAPQHLKAIYA